MSIQRFENYKQIEVPPTNCKHGQVARADSTWRLVQHHLNDSPYELELNHLDSVPLQRAVTD